MRKAWRIFWRLFWALSEATGVPLPFAPWVVAQALGAKRYWRVK